MNNCEIFKAKSILKFGEQFEYIDLTYTNNKTELKLKCKDHGFFNIKPNAHLRSKTGGCSECERKVRFELFKEKSILKFDDQFKLIESTYINNKTNVYIHCKIHDHNFSILPPVHIQSKTGGCSECERKVRFELFKTKSILKFGNQFEYVESTYINDKIPMEIINIIYGKFKITPAHHLKSKLGITNEIQLKINFENFKVQVIRKYDGLYEYDGLLYVNDKIPMEIVCKKHGPFNQTPLQHKLRSGCKDCILEWKKEKALKRFKYIHGERYDYSKFVYVNLQTKIIIGCPIHGEFEQMLSDHLSGCGCPKCSMGGVSGVSIRWLDALGKELNTFIQHAMNIGEYRIPGTRYKADGFAPDINTICEFHGNKTHGNPRIYKDTDRPNPFNNKTAKELYADTIARENHIKSLGYNLVVIWEDEYKAINENDK